MMGHRGVKKGGDEWDAFTSWRRVLYWQAGELRRIKRRYNKRQRKLVRMELRKWNMLAG
jgi:hypothetical protein